MIADRHSFALVDKLNLLAWCAVITVLLVSCERSPQVLGRINLKSGEETKFAFCIPARPHSQVGWSLRFGMIPWAQFESLKDLDGVTVYLSNDNNASVGFLRQLGLEKTVIRPGEKVEIFEGKLSEFILLGRGEREAMAFDPAAKNLNFTLYFEPRLKSESSCTIQVSIGHYPDLIL